MDLPDEQLRQLLNEGLSQREISKRTGIARTTLQRRLQRLGLSPVQGSAKQSGTVQSGTEQPSPSLVPSPAATSAAIIDLLRQTLARLDTVEQDLKILREEHKPGAVQSSSVQSSSVQSRAEATPLTPDEAKAERWNLWLPRGLRQRIEALAKARGHAPSKVVQEILWNALTDRNAPPS